MNSRKRNGKPKARDPALGSAAPVASGTSTSAAPTITSTSGASAPPVVRS